jgi:hypothetical protein
VEKNISFTVPQAPGEGKGQYVRVVLERRDGDSWFPYTDTTSYIINTKQTANLTYRIKQDTSGVKKYRFHVAANAVLDMSDTVSPEFTVTGERQDPGLAVGYSKSSQRYKKSSVTVTVKMAQAYAGKATIYDGKKKLKTLTIKNGKTVTYKLSKNLKRGNHKITVKFVPGEEFAPFYKTVTSKAKTIKVKK